MTDILTGTKISSMDTVNTVADDDLVPIVRNGENFVTTVAMIADAVPLPTPTPPTWGAVVGTLANQTDLNTALVGLQSDVNNKGMDSVATLLTTSIDNTTTAIRVNGYTYPGDGGGALWKRADSQVAGYGRRQSHDGAWWEIAELTIDPRMLGAVGFAAFGVDATDDTATINEALQMGRPLRLSTIHKIKDKISTLYNSTIIGDHRATCGFLIESDFNMSAAGVLAPMTHAEPGPRFENFGIYFYQDNTISARASLIQYPPAVDLRTLPTPRFFAKNLRIQGGYNGLDLRGNNGGVHLEDLELGCFNKNVMFDSPLSVVYMNGIDVYPYGYNTGTIYDDVWSDGETVAFELVSVSGLQASNLRASRAKGTIDGGFGQIGSYLGNDQSASLTITNGALYTIGSLYSTETQGEDFALTVDGTGTSVSVNTSHISMTGALTTSNGLIQLINAAAELFLGNVLISGGSDTGSTYIYQTGGHLQINGGSFHPSQDSDIGVPLVKVTGGIIEMTNVRVLDKGAGTGEVINIANDDTHVLSQISAPGWTVTLPADSELMNLADNTWSATSRLAGSRRVLGLKVFEFIGTLDGSGTATIAHGLTTLTSNNPIIQAWQGDSPELMTGVTYDNTNITLSAGTDSEAYRVVVMY